METIAYGEDQTEYKKGGSYFQRKTTTMHRPHVKYFLKKIGVYNSIIAGSDNIWSKWAGWFLPFCITAKKRY